MTDVGIGDWSASGVRSPGQRVIVVDALAARFGGTAYAVVQMMLRLAALPEVERVVVVTRAGSIVARGLVREEGGALNLVVLPEARVFELVRRAFWQAFRLPGVVSREGADWLITYSGMLPRAVGCDVVSYLLNPVAFQTRRLGPRLRRRAILRTARFSRWLVTPSEGMAELVERAAARRPTVVPLGVDTKRFSPAEQPGESVLCVADFYKHKRHDLLLSAWQALEEPRPPLRLIGNPRVDISWHSKITEMVRQSSVEGIVTVESDLPFSKLVEAYREARVFVLPSTRESFSMPLAESMAAGVPAITTDLRALRETGARGCLYIGSDDPQVWAAAIAELLQNDALYNELRHAARRQGSLLDWDRSATAMANLLVGSETERA